MGAVFCCSVGGEKHQREIERVVPMRVHLNRSHAKETKTSNSREWCWSTNRENTPLWRRCLSVLRWGQFAHSLGCELTPWGRLDVGVNKTGPSHRGFCVLSHRKLGKSPDRPQRALPQKASDSAGNVLRWANITMRRSLYEEALQRNCHVTG